MKYMWVFFQSQFVVVVDLVVMWSSVASSRTPHLISTTWQERTLVVELCCAWQGGDAPLEDWVREPDKARWRKIFVLVFSPVTSPESQAHGGPCSSSWWSERCGWPVLSSPWPCPWSWSWDRSGWLASRAAAGPSCLHNIFGRRQGLPSSLHQILSLEMSAGFVVQVFLIMIS